MFLLNGFYLDIYQWPLKEVTYVSSGTMYVSSGDMDQNSKQNSKCEPLYPVVSSIQYAKANFIN